MKFYNTLTRQVEEFIPRQEGKVKMYTCGPTVYNFAHIGNLRTYLMEDVLEKTLRYLGYDVTRVMNITDIGHLSDDADSGEDKMLLGAKREHKTVRELAAFYTDAFFADCEKLNIKRPDVVQPATGCVDEFIRVIEALMEKGYAYKAGGNVYFDTSKVAQYHKFFNFKEEDLEVGVREGVDEDENKRNKNDFVLWFTKSKFEDQALKWDSPWGVGYPGWHIECSCIAMKYLGDTSISTAAASTTCSPPHQRDRPERSVPRPRMVPLLVPCAAPEHGGRQDEQVFGRLFDPSKTGRGRAFPHGVPLLLPAFALPQLAGVFGRYLCQRRQRLPQAQKPRRGTGQRRGSGRRSL